MAKQIVIDYQDKEYVLEFTRKTVQMMERGGFSLEELDAKPMTMILTLFTGAFAANHSNIKRAKVEEIYDTLAQKQELLTVLVEMYNETLETLMGNDEADGDSKNVTWTTR